MQYVTSRDGTRIGYKRTGAGSPLLLVHGSTADHTRWDKIAPRFEPFFSLYAPDRRGRGASADAPHYDLLREAEDIATLIEAAAAHSGENVAVLGHSFGGICSLEAALLTQRVGRLILYEPPLPTGLPLYAPDLPGRLQTLIDRGEWEAALELFYREQVKMPEPQLAAYRALPIWPERVKIAPTLVREIDFDRGYRFDPARFRQLEIPTLLLLGSDSPPIFQQATAALAAALPASRLVILPGQQHIAMDTAPDLFASAVLEFLNPPGKVG